MSRIVWFAPRPVWPVHGGGQLRTLGLIRWASNAGHDVLLVQPTSSAGISHYPNDLRVINLRLRRGLPRAVAKLTPPVPLRSPRVTRKSMREAHRAIGAFQPDVAIAADIFAWHLASSLARAETLIYDAHNVESVLFRVLRQDARGPIRRLTYAIDAHRIARLERQALDTAAAVVMVSAEDLRALPYRPRTERVVVVPNSVDLPPIAATPARAMPTMLFVGSLSYPPNEAAVWELLTKVLPAARSRIPDARLLVVGRSPSARLRRELSRTAGADLADNIDDLEPVYRSCRCVVLPIRTGSGTRLKVYEALAHGVPVVATPEAIAGIALTGGVEALVHSATEELTGAAISLLADPHSADDIGRAGRDKFERELAWAHVATPLGDVVGDLARIGSAISTPHIGGQ